MPDSAPLNDSRESSDSMADPTRALSSAGGIQRPYSQDLTEQTLGDYRVLRRIGRGGMSEVYLAQQSSLNRNVALKILRPDLVADETHVKRFRTEALAVAGLNHPNIIQVYSVGVERGIEYIAQEYVQGYNLRQFLVRKGPPDLPVALHILKQVASALAAAAKAGVVHRDIKPENILITRNGTVKVADFGLAQLTLQGERVNLTQVGITMGTPLYMSPEQVNGSKVGPQSDIYSFGVTAYHLLSGSPPFRGETAMSIAVQHVKNDPLPLEQSRPDLPILLCRIVHKMMAKKLDDRYRTAEAVLADLKRVAQQADNDIPLQGTDQMPTAEDDTAPIESTRSMPVKSLAALPDRPFKQQVKPLLAAVGALFVLGFVAGWLALPGNPLDVEFPLETTEIPKKASAGEQFFYAVSVGGTEKAWQAVGEHFQDDKIFVDAADKRLAMLYLEQGRYDEASAIFRKFIEASASEPENRAFGHAGMVILLCEQGRHRESQSEYADHLSVVSPESLFEKLDTPIQERVDAAVAENKDALKDVRNGQ